MKPPYQKSGWIHYKKPQYRKGLDKWKQANPEEAKMVAERFAKENGIKPC